MPAETVDFVARHLDLRFDAWTRYDWSGSSWKRHRRQIRANFGFRAWTDDDIEPLIRAVVDEMDGDAGTRRDRLTEVAIHWCRRCCVEPPAPTRLDRFVGSAISAWERAAADEVAGRLGTSTIERLEWLVDPDQRELLASLRRTPGAVGVETVLSELEKLSVLTGIAVPTSALSNFSGQVVEQWHDRFAITRPSALAAMSEADRAMLTAAWVHHRSASVIDSVVDLLIAIAHKIGAKAERGVEREHLADLKRVNGKTNMLYRLAEAVLDNPDGIVSEVLFPIVNEDILRDRCRVRSSPQRH